MLRRFVRPRLASVPTPQHARADFFLKMTLLPYPVRRMAIEQEMVGDVPVERLTPRDAEADAALIYFHGGAYIMGAPATHRSLTARLARMTRLAVHVPDYRLAPEHPFPAAVEDALAVYAGLLKRGIPASRIVLGGESAGGGLALAMVQAARRAGLPDPGAMMLFSPWTDLSLSGDSNTTNIGSEPMLPAERSQEIAGYYLAGADPRDPLASPLFGDWTSPPRALIHASDIELIRDDSVRLAAVLHAGGGEVAFRLWHDLPHGWQLGAGLLPEGMASLRMAARFARGCLDRGSDEQAEHQSHDHERAECVDAVDGPQFARAPGEAIVKDDPWRDDKGPQTGAQPQA